MKSRVTGILLLFCLVAPITATVIFLHYQKKQIRKEVKRQIISGIDKEELVLLKFTEAESETKVQWRHSKEFEHAGQMYDIVEKESIGDTIFYWCWWDHEETKLNKRLNELASIALGNDAPSRNAQNHLFDFNKSLFCANQKVLLRSLFEPRQKNSSNKFCYSFFSSSPPSPPPEIG